MSLPRPPDGHLHRRSAGRGRRDQPVRYEMGVKIPDDVSIIGFDDAYMRNNVYPKLSAICQDAEQLGYEAVSALTGHLMDGPTTPYRKVLPTWLELHRTTGRPPGDAVRASRRHCAWPTRRRGSSKAKRTTPLRRGSSS